MITAQPITALSANVPPAVAAGKAVTKKAAPAVKNSAGVPADAHILHLLHQSTVNPKALNPSDLHALHMFNHPELDVNRYLTNDTTYQSQMSAIHKALGDYGANELQQENSYNSGYALNRANLDEQKRTTGIDQSEDFGSRGMVRSGLYGVANTDRLNDFANQYSQLDQGRSDYLMNLHQGLSNYNSSQLLAQQQARQDAINRRAIGLIGNSSSPAVK